MTLPMYWLMKATRVHKLYRMTTGDAGHSSELDADSIARRNLLLSFPELDVAYDGRDVVDSLVDGVIAHLLTDRGAESMVILNDVSSKLKTTMGLSYEPAELIASFERLAARGHLSFRDETHRSFVYTTSTFQSSIEALRLRMATWDAVRVAWIDEVRQRAGLDEAQGRLLWHALDALVTKLIDMYGAEAATFLYLDDAKARARFFDALGERLPESADTVPDDLREIAKEEFPAFFDPSNASRTDYLCARLRASFFFHLLSVDPTASALVRAQVSEKIFYLDSNFIFRLIGFHGPLRAFSPVTTVDISTLLNCKLSVAQETINEYLRVVKANVGRLNSTPIRRPAYVRIASEHPSDEGEFMAAYYREFHSGRVKSVEEFGRKWSNIEPFLQEWGITIDKEAWLTEEERHAESFLDDVSRLQRWNETKNPAAVDHDVFMMHLIRRNRGKMDATRAHVRYWFLTFDRQLTRYSAKYATDELLPVVLFADDWLLIARPFLPRTDDYAKSFVAMLQYPILYQGSATVPFAHMANALSRLEAYEELPAQVVAAMVADDQFVRSFIEAKTEDDARSLIETRAGSVARDAISRNEMLEGKLDQMQKQISILTDNRDTLHNARDAATMERDRARQNAADAERQIADMKRDFPVVLQAAVAQAANAAATETERKLLPMFEARFKNTQRWTAYWCIIAVVTILGLGGLAFNWNQLTPARRGLVFMALAMVWVGLLWIPKGARLALSVVGTAASVAGLALAAYVTWIQFPKPGTSRTTPPVGVSESVRQDSHSVR